ncbi:MAG: hypothetical protein ACLRZ2_02820 [Veillonella sp.]
MLDATFDDLSLLEFERMRSMISKYRGDQSLLELDNLKLAQALQLVQTVDDTVHPTMAGLILLGKRRANQGFNTDCRVCFHHDERH